MKTVWEGSFFIWHSLAHVNRELASRLANLKAVQGIVPHERDLSGALVYPHGKQLRALAKAVKGPKITVRHAFPPNFSPHDGPVVLMQPWEFLRAPKEWVDAVNSGQVDELWCNSNFTRNCYVLSGVQPHRVRALPLGYDDKIFTPEGRRADAEDEAEFRFLYVGGTIERKGIDILMRAFLAEFRRQDPVRLIVKDTATKTAYVHNNQSEPILKVVNDPNAPHVEYLDGDLTGKALADLMRSCHCLVQPYRGEGFCLPVVEAMACGLPVIVTYGGPTDDLVLHSCGWKIASQRVQIAQLHGYESIDDQGWMEPDQLDVQRALREAFENRKLAKAMGSRAAEVAKQWSWDQVAPLYQARIEELKATAARPVKPRPTLSVCMIAKNEERCIGEALASVKGFADEIIVSDTGSTDRTVEIAREQGAQLRHFKWVDSFSAARNDSTKDAKGDWIFWIDCDDVVPEETMRAILGAIEHAPEEVWGLNVPVRFLDGTQVDHIKVYRNKPELQWEFRIHEQILGPIRKGGGGIGLVEDAYVLHKNYDTSSEGQAAKRKRDWKLLMLDLKEHPNHPFVLFNCGMTAQNVGQPKKAIPWLKKCLLLSGPSDSIYRKACEILARSYLDIGHRHKARSTLIKGLDQLPNDPEMQFRLAQIEHEAGNLDRAADLYKQIDPSAISQAFTSLDRGLLGFKRNYNLGNVELERGNYSAARANFLTVLKEQPKEIRAAISLFDAALANRDLGTARDVHKHVQRMEGYSENWVAMLLRIVPEPEKALTDLVDIAPGSPAPRLHLARLLLNSGRQVEAVPHLTILADSGEAEAAYFLGVVASDMGDKQEARRRLTQAILLNPNHPDTKKRLERLDSDA